MAKLPTTVEALIDRYGPHLNEMPAAPASAGPEHLVKTHCCFCGVQCGIQLKVKDNAVVGFEPWEEFPLNKGMLCPKGVKRYLQGSHRDRLTEPLIRTGTGFREATWAEAMDLVEKNIRRIQGDHGRDSFALLSG